MGRWEGVGRHVLLHADSIPVHVRLAVDQLASETVGALTGVGQVALLHHGIQEWVLAQLAACRGAVQRGAAQSKQQLGTLQQQCVAVPASGAAGQGRGK